MRIQLTSINWNIFYEIKGSIKLYIKGLFRKKSFYEFYLFIAGEFYVNIVILLFYNILNYS